MKFNRKIIIVDDNPSIHEDIKSILLPRESSNAKELEALEAELFGEVEEAPKTDLTGLTYEVDSAYQGEEAITMIKEAYEKGEPYCMAFMDVRMPPGIDGIETIKRVWKDYPDLEVVICTAYSDYSWDQIIEKLSRTDKLLFLKKPFESAAVQQMALSLTEKWNLNQQAKNLIVNLEDKVAERTEELEAARAKTVYASKMASLGEMAGGIAHEINNPLTVVITSAELLIDTIEEDPNSKDQILNYSNKIMNMADRISKIVRSLKKLTRNGKNDPFQMTNIHAIIDDTLELCGQKVKQGNIELRIGDYDKQLQIECRGSEISQTILNLVGNSVDAIMDLEEKWVSIDIEDLGESLKIMITDSGPGIPADVKDKILQPFYTTKEVGKGTGLGLPISKSLIESHHGTFDIDSSCENTRFIITIPKKQTESANEAA